MTFSTLGYAFYSSAGNQEDKGKIIEYKGIEFKQTNYGSWIFNIQGHDFETMYNPLETTNISVITTKNLQDYADLPLYFGIESEKEISALGISELSRNLDNFILRSGIACLEKDCSDNYPIKNCTDNMIVFKQENFTRVREENGCIYVYSNNIEAERASDALLYRLFGI